MTARPSGRRSAHVATAGDAPRSPRSTQIPSPSTAMTFANCSKPSRTFNAPSEEPSRVRSLPQTSGVAGYSPPRSLSTSGPTAFGEPASIPTQSPRADQTRSPPGNAAKHLVRMQRGRCAKPRHLPPEQAGQDPDDRDGDQFPLVKVKLINYGNRRNVRGCRHLGALTARQPSPTRRIPSRPIDDPTRRRHSSSDCGLCDVRRREPRARLSMMSATLQHARKDHSHG